MDEENYTRPTIPSSAATPATPSPETPPAQPSLQHGPLVIQPSESIRQELQAMRQTQTQTQVQQPATTIPSAQASQSAMSPPNPTDLPQQHLTDPTQSQTNQTAHQSINTTAKKRFYKRPLNISLLALVVLCGIGAALLLPSMLNQNELAATNYTSNENTQYKLDFYSTHTTKKLKSSNYQLVSEITKSGKFPLGLSISAGNEVSYNSLKNCANIPKAFDVHNSHLAQKISVCDLLANQKAPDGGDVGSVYVAAFKHSGKVHIITITQDHSSVDLSSKAAAAATLERFSMKPYTEDIKQIVASIQVE